VQKEQQQEEHRAKLANHNVTHLQTIRERANQVHGRACACAPRTVAASARSGAAGGCRTAQGQPLGRVLIA
jgi:hypothetical protein